MSFLIYPREAITSNGGRGGDNRGNRRRPFRRRGHSGQENNDRQNRNERTEKPRAPVIERPKWVPPPVPNDPIPVPNCSYCGKPIRDIAAALCEKGTGNAVHFDCIITRISQDETPEKGDFVSYIGGGRFGIVHFNNPGDPKKFTIKKVIEWENKDERPEWRSLVSDHYSVT